MKKILYLISGFLSFFGTMPGYAASTIPKPPLLNQSQQLIVVTTDNWDTYQGYLQPYERSAPNQPWQPVGNGWPVVVGKAGLGWGNNYKNYAVSGPIKKEGDKKAPAGAFAIGSAFGFSSTTDPQLKLPYIPINANIVCVDDSHSKYYGKIIDTSKVATKDWNSAEIMIENDPAYIQGLVVNYNTHGDMLNGGSCIFMHIRSSPDSDGTAGCTAMAQNNVTWLWHWLNPNLHPALVQMPKAQYTELQKAWGLPKR